jgi:GLPGLI family protein
MVSQNRYKQAKKFFDLAKEFKYILEFNPDESLYYIVEPLIPDNIDKTTYTLAKILGGTDSVYQDKKKKMSYLRNKHHNKIILEYQNLYKNWNILPETDTILGYKVIKAESGRTKVWFAPDIPVPFGPDMEGGLPGLILKFQMGDRIIQAKSIVFSNKKLSIIPPSKGELISKTKLENLMWNKRMEILKKNR